MRYPALRGEAEVLQAAETRDRLARNGVDLFIGSAELVPAQASMSGTLAVRVCRPTGCVELPASKVCIATGSRAHRPKEIAPGVAIPFTKGIVVDSTEMGQIAELPNAVAILGGGVIAVEYATVLARLGVGVSLLCQDKDFMSFLTEELRDALRKRMPKRLRVDMVLYSGGRDANSEGLLCEAAGIEIGRFGRVMVDDTGCTANKDVYAVGDVVGAGLASAAAQQGRGVADRLFLDQMLRRARALLNTAAPLEDAIDDPFFASAAPAPPPPRTAEAPESIDDPFFASGAAAAAEKPDGEGDGTGRTLFGTAARAGTPLTLWTIPEIACVGLSEEAARELEVAGRLGGGGGGDATVVVGYAYFKDLARGRLSGDPEGFLKIIARAEAPARHVVVGVHIMGEGANELIQLGSVLVHAGATLEQVGNTPFAAVTLSALYQVASDDALCRSPLNLQRVRAR
ncbi:soluble pyridine nucleotide transhydogenase [Tribonema minus]|uniref:NAD(P)(+) transhydrogenase (Si-specific) n=1 Tax=Tribonema minus TaxID=303371 RepID=A0A836CA28_9STRA|nr:soluble pyridine nucleotide transhydogenase [Tribonema minus]